MKRLLIILSLFILSSILVYSQNTEIEIDDNEEEQLDFFIVDYDINCNKSELEILGVNIVHCDSIIDKNLLPSEFHKNYLKSRIISIERNFDTLTVKLVLKSDCCPKFISSIECLNDTLIDLKCVDIGEVFCFCGSCPFILTYRFLDKKRLIKSYNLNGKYIVQSNDIYRNSIKIEKINSENGNRIIETYFESVNKNSLLLIEEKNEQGDTELLKTYYLGKEIKAVQDQLPY